MLHLYYPGILNRITTGGNVDDFRGDKTRRLPVLARLKVMAKKHKMPVIIVSAVLVALIFVIILVKLKSPTHLQPVADNAVVREYRDKLPELKAEAQKSPHSFNARRAYAQALYVVGDKQAAKAEYEAASRLNPKDAVTKNNLGNVYRDLEDYAAATDAYREAYQLDPSLINAYVNLATMQSYTLKKTGDAVSTYKYAVSKNGQSVDLLLLLGDAYEQNGQKELALSTYRTVLEKDPDNMAAKRNIDRLNK